MSHAGGVVRSTDEVLPVLETDLAGNPIELVHQRAYIVHAYRRGLDEMLLRGSVRDDKPAGLYIVGDENPLVIHHMIVELGVAMPALTITSAHVAFEVFPHTTCPLITTSYEDLVGLSIARGFIHEVRKRFGGPGGCAHTTALIQAMAPVAIQSIWSFKMAAQRDDREGGATFEAADDEAATERSVRASINTCHFWAEDGEQVARVRRGERGPVPLFITERLIELGRDPATWRGGDDIR